MAVASAHEQSTLAAKPAEHTAKDPVCGMTVDTRTAKHRHTHAGQPYYFCAARCREKFIAEPEKYVARSASPAGLEAPVPMGAIYICPMHPEIRQQQFSF